MVYYTILHYIVLHYTTRYGMNGWLHHLELVAFTTHWEDLRGLGYSIV